MAVSKKTEREQFEVLLFKDGPLSFALQLQEIKEIVNLRRIVPLPFTAPFMVGLVNLRGSVVPLVSPYLLQSGKGRYIGDVEYASIVEYAGIEVAIACQKIYGVKSVYQETYLVGGIYAPIVVEGKRAKLLRVAPLVDISSELLLDSKFRVQA
jgi:chemotaxis signal transduction protein